MLGKASRLLLMCYAVALLLTLGAADTHGAPARASGKLPGLRASLRTEITKYLTSRRKPEHISAVSLRVTFRGHRRSIDLAAGTTRYGGGRPIPTHNLWQIGSNTKAFTSVLMLQLEAAGKLSINDPVAKWLPEYGAWQGITIRQLLNMTSGIEDFESLPSFFRAYAAAPNTVFAAPSLVSYVVGAPLLTGWNYSNTNYVLAEMIIERAGGDTFANQLRKRISKPLGLRSLVYCPAGCPRRVIARLPASSYFFSTSTLPELASLVGKDQHRRNLSYARAAGAIISSLPDLTKWFRALYGGRMLPRKQQRELTSLVSEATGKPIRRTTLSDPAGYGLGVGQGITRGRRVWDYEGENLSFRLIHIFVPKSGTVLAIAVNSGTDNDQLGKLAIAVYDTLRKAGAA
jgi:D-alanyl-D-alanine carboxypeptidase